MSLDKLFTRFQVNSIIANGMLMYIAIRVLDLLTYHLNNGQEYANELIVALMGCIAAIAYTSRLFASTGHKTGGHENLEALKYDE